jgi:hypothetical protein
MNIDPRKNPQIVNEAHTRLMLRYLAKSDFATAKILQDYLGVNEKSSISHKLKGWQRLEFIEEVEVPRPFGGRPLKVYKLTQHGQGMALSIGAEPREEVKIPLSGLEHAFMVQRTLIALTRLGYYGFELDKQIANAQERFGHYPDMVCFNKHLKRVAIECERTIKSRSRYKQIALNFVRALRNQNVSKVIYVVPDESVRRGIESTLRAALSDSFKRGGLTLDIEPSEMAKLIMFVTLEQLEEQAKKGHFMRFHGYHSPQLKSFCMIHFAGLIGGKKSIIIESLGENSWTSTTNAIEEVAPAALEMLNEEQARPNGIEWKPEEVRFFEHWNGRNSLAGDDAFIPVDFEGQGFTQPRWDRVLTGEEKEALKNWMF